MSKKNKNDGCCCRCKHYKDYGCLAAHITSVDGVCLVDNHQVDGALSQCTIFRYQRRDAEFHP